MGTEVARDDKLVDVERVIAEQASEVARHLGITRAQYLSDLLRQRVYVDYLASLKSKLDTAQGEIPRRPKRKGVSDGGT